jgi:hypothetical protein
MSATQKKIIFISHSSLNQSVTNELYQSLTGRYQLATWMDAFDLHTDQGPFSAEIVNALRASNLLVLVDSPAARDSDYVARETQLGRDMQLPVYRCSIDEQQPALLRKIQIHWLAWRIRLRLVRGFLISALFLFLLLAALLAGTYLLARPVILSLAAPAAPALPAAYRPSATFTATVVPTPSNPKLAAPFHFKPDTILLQDGFDDPAFENSFNPQTMHYDLVVRDAHAKVGQQNGSFVINFPVECQTVAKQWDCEEELDSNVLEAGAIQYFGFRARTLERTPLRGVSVSISVNGPNRSRAGFGWDFTDHAMAFFRSIPALAEKDLYAYVTIDLGWHAYEIVRNTQNARVDYYVDGQLVGTYTPLHARDWDQAPLRLIIYSLKGLFDKSESQTGTRFEMDEFIIGGFKSR